MCADKHSSVRVASTLQYDNMVPPGAVASLERDRRASSGSDTELRTPTSSAVPSSDSIIVSFVNS